MGSLGLGVHKVLFEPSKHLWQVWGFILNPIFPSNHLVWASPLSLNMGNLFGVGSNILLSMVVQQLFAILVFSQEMSAWSSTPSSLYPPDKIPWTGHKTYTCRFQQDTQPIIVI